MDSEGHIIIGFLVFALLILFGYIDLFGTQLNKFIFLISYIVFSTKISPDIDLKVGIAHRKITHEFKFQALIILITGAILWFVFNTYNLNSSVIIPFLIGFALAWGIHSTVDVVYDKLGKWTWILILLPIIWVAYTIG